MTVDGTDNSNKRDAGGDMECLAARDLVHRRVDGEASTDEIARLNAHLKQCPACERYAGETIRVMSQLSSLRAASESPPEAITPSIERENITAGHGRLRLPGALLRIAAVIAIGFVGVWAWSTMRDRPGLRLADGGPEIVNTSSSPFPQGQGMKLSPSPKGANQGDSPRHTARVINPRSQNSTYIPVARDTGRPNVKMFALYKDVRGRMQAPAERR